MRSAHVQQHSMQVQQQLPAALIAKVGFVGNLGHRLDTSWNYNQPVPSALFAIAPNITDATVDGKSNYNWVQA